MEKYKAIEDVVVREIAGDYLLISVGKRVLDHNEIVQLSETGKFLWELIAEKAYTIDELAGKLVQEFIVEETEAIEDTNSFIEELKKEKLVEIET